jgi:hypothetical protein
VGSAEGEEGSQTRRRRSPTGKESDGEEEFRAKLKKTRGLVLVGPT